MKNEYIERLISERKRIKAELEALPGMLKVFDSDCNFLLFKCPDAKKIQLELAGKGVIIRDRSSYKMLENCLRLSIGTEEENNMFLEEIKKLL